MKILTVGSGAMGCLVAGKLKQSKADVTIFNRENSHIRKIERSGLRISEINGDISSVNIPVLYDPNKLADHYDLIIVLVKTFANEKVLKKISHAVNKETIILSLQNGVGNIEKLHSIFPDNPIGAGGTSSGASILGDGVIEHRATGDTYIGGADNRHDKEFKEIAALLTHSGLTAYQSDRVQSVIWNKLLVNVAYNALTAITRLKNGDVIAEDEGKEIVKALVHEAIEVAEAEGIELSYIKPVNEIIELGIKHIGRNKSSMLSDVLNERKTEVDVINGAIVQYGKKHSIATPYNKLILNLIKVIEKSYAKTVNGL